MQSDQQTKETSTRTALIYCRVASGNAKGRLDEQEHRCREHANASGYDVEAVFRETASGVDGVENRSGLRGMLDHIDTHKDTRYVVIIDDLNRLSRDLLGHTELRRALSERGATVECPNFDFDESPEGSLIETIMVARAQYLEAKG